ncbi:MAG: ABC transporter permease, partial [Planctomycetota bacterium]
LLATLERTRELGVLKALGASRRQIGGAMLLEALVVGIVGGGLGIALGLGAAPLVVGALESLVGLDLEPRTAGAWVPITFAGAVALALLSALHPIRRAHTVDAVRAVRTR